MLTASEARVELEAARAAFRGDMSKAGAADVWARFTGRIGVVLSGGGARGAYEAGALLAFQDAALPTHVIAATSIGGINAASFVAHSNTRVGNAERLIENWHALTPGLLGIEWTRYGWMLVGLIACSAGVGNLVAYLATLLGIEVHLHSPAAAWTALALGGASLLLFYPQLPYLHFVLRRWLDRDDWDLDPARLRASIVANVLVAGFVLVIVFSLHLHTTFSTLLVRSPLVVLGALVALAVLRLWQRRAGGAARLSRMWERLLRIPLTPGLFKNFERARYLRAEIPAPPIAASPIRLVITATDIKAGRPRYFTNAAPEALAADPGVDQEFVSHEVVQAHDLLPAVVAASALPIAFEPLWVDGHLLADGAIVGSQPIRPALRLGADVLFIVLLNPPRTAAPAKANSFVDVGIRALDILIHQNLRVDLQTAQEVNDLCESTARQLGLPAEAITISIGRRRFRYVRTFTIRPTGPLRAGILDFGNRATGEMLLQGYRDAADQIREFLAYAPQAQFGGPRRVLGMALAGEAG